VINAMGNQLFPFKTPQSPPPQLGIFIPIKSKYLSLNLQIIVCNVLQILRADVNPLAPGNTHSCLIGNACPPNHVLRVPNDGKLACMNILYAGHWELDFIDSSCSLSLSQQTHFGMIPYFLYD